MDSPSKLAARMDSLRKLLLRDGGRVPNTNAQRMSEGPRRIRPILTPASLINRICSGSSERLAIPVDGGTLVMLSRASVEMIVSAFKFNGSKGSS